MATMDNCGQSGCSPDFDFEEDQGNMVDSGFRVSQSPEDKRMDCQDAKLELNGVNPLQ